ncbi:hypothetical protein ACOMHN_038873 [Nucella lapillus]
MHSGARAVWEGLTVGTMEYETSILGLEHNHLPSSFSPEQQHRPLCVSLWHALCAAILAVFPTQYVSTRGSALNIFWILSVQSRT